MAMKLVTTLVSVCIAACSAPPAPPVRNDVPPPPAPTFESKLHGDKRERFEKYTLSFASPCGRAHSLRTSLASDPACTRTPHALHYLENLIDSDTDDDQLHRLYDGRIGVAYKHFPLSRNHPLARGAAIAVIAADRQGKFLAMQREVFANQGQLSAQDLETYAQRSGLDLARYRQDIASPELAAIVDGDVAEANVLELPYVPVLFINGRQYEGSFDQPTLADVIAEELEAAER